MWTFRGRGRRDPKLLRLEPTELRVQKALRVDRRWPPARRSRGQRAGLRGSTLGRELMGVGAVPRARLIALAGRRGEGRGGLRRTG